VSVQNRDFRGLGDRHITDSAGRFGRAGTAESCLADDVGKYMTRRRAQERSSKYSLGQLRVALSMHSCWGVHVMLV
jgi:hypothetical protein